MFSMQHELHVTTKSLKPKNGGHEWRQPWISSKQSGLLSIPCRCRRCKEIKIIMRLIRCTCFLDMFGVCAHFRRHCPAAIAHIYNGLPLPASPTSSCSCCSSYSGTPMDASPRTGLVIRQGCLLSMLKHIPVMVRN